MKRTIAILFSMLWIGMSANAEPGFVITINDGNTASITETRVVDLKTGHYDLFFPGVPVQIDPRSVKLNTKGLTVMRQVFENDPTSTEGLLRKHVNQQLQVVLEGGDLVEGTLLSADQLMRKSTNTIVIQHSDGSIRSIALDHVREIRFPNPGQMMNGGPALQWLVNSDLSGKQEVNVDYTANGLGWNADYQLYLDPDDKTGMFYGWANVHNSCGMTFQNAKLNLAAGASTSPKFRKKASKDRERNENPLPVPMPKPSCEGTCLYTLEGLTTLPDNSQTRLSLFEPVQIPASIRYEYNHYEDATQVTVSAEMNLDKLTRTKSPLPSGLIRVWGATQESDENEIGSGQLGLPREDGKVIIPFGIDPDIAVVKSEISNERVGKSGHNWRYRVIVKNEKEQLVTVVIKESYEGEWDITDATGPYDRCEDGIVEFPVSVKPNSEATLEYTRLRYDYHGPRGE